MPKDILILMSDTGGGHRASAEAIAEGVDHLYGDEIRVHIVDAWRHYSPWPYNRICDAYPWLVGDGVWLWNILWRSDDWAWLPRWVAKMATPIARRSMAEMYREISPDLVVSVHPILNHVPVRVLHSVLNSDVPFVTVVTDMVTAHPAWFCPDVDYCMVPTEIACQRALRYGMSPHQVEVVGQPIGLKFASGVGDKLHLRGKLGLDLDRPVVLVVGGGEGMGPVYEIARAIARGVPNAQLIVVTGRNAALRQKLEATTWEIPTHICGFVTNMPEWMGASDVLVTKAGPGTLSEAFIAGLPVIISSYIPGQEEGNVRYVLEHQAGAYATDPSQMASLLNEWLHPANSNQLQQLTKNAAALARPEASLSIAKRLNHLLRERDVARPIPQASGHSVFNRASVRARALWGFGWRLIRRLN